MRGRLRVYLGAAPGPARGLVEAMGGSLEPEDTPGGGLPPPPGIRQTP